MTQMNLLRLLLCSSVASLILSISTIVRATDSRCPSGMNSPDGVICVPGESMHDEVRAIQNRPSNFLPMRDPALDKMKAKTAEMKARVLELAKLHQDPDYLRYLTGKWKFPSSPESKKKGEYCSIFFSRGGVILTLAGPGGDYKGASLIFTSGDIPRPETQETVKVVLIQNNEPPAIVKAVNYSKLDHSFGSIIMAVPSIDALLANMEDVQHFDLQIEGRSIAKINWHSGLAARAELRNCLSGKPYTVTQIDLLGR